MRIDNDSYYIRYCVYPDDEEFAFLSHYIDVWDNGYSIEIYTFDNNGIGYEDASHKGVVTDECKAGTRILRRGYDRWVKKVNDCKLEIEKIVQKNSFPCDKEWSVGDYLYIPFREIYAKEVEEYPDDYEEDENKDIGPHLYLIHITNADIENMEGRMIYIHEYRCDFYEEPTSISEFYEYSDDSRFISKGVFENVKELIRKVKDEILSEIKNMVKEIEYK